MPVNTQPASIVILNGAQAQAIVHTFNAAQSKVKPDSVNYAIGEYLAWLKRNYPESTVHQNGIFCRAFARDMKLENRQLARVEEHHVKDWVNKDGKLSTRRVRLAILRGFFKFCTIKQLLNGPNVAMLARVDFNSMSHEQKEAKIVQPFTDADFEKILSHLKTEIAEQSSLLLRYKFDQLMDRREKVNRLCWWYAAVVISRCTGLRMGDVAQLEWAAFAGVFTCWTDKRNRRVQPHIWHKELFDKTIQALPRSEQFVFPEIRRVYLNPRTRTTLAKDFKRLSLKLDLSQSVFHAWRHFYSNDCLSKGVPMPHISQYLGHTSIKTTAGYCQTNTTP
jgi:integrase